MAEEYAVRPEANELLRSVAEQLKVPLAIIARQAELVNLPATAAAGAGHLTDATTGGQLAREITAADAATIATQADAALLLVDSYLLGLELLRSQSQLALEPVSLSSLLLDSAHELHGFARQYGVEVAVETPGRLGPVMGNARGLKAALLSLGFALVEAQSAAVGASLVASPLDAKAAGYAKQPRVLLAAHRTPHGMVAGIYGAAEAMTAAAWRRAQVLCGTATQPLTALGGGTAAGLFVADAILRSMDSRLRVGRYARTNGLAATLQQSRQLQLV